jgi:4-diphosphocytidyl-2C-methyl-D-erythritol kinase
MKQSCLPLITKSFAKLNLYLKILNKRKDKFHNLNTLFCRIDLADTIILKNRKDNLIKIKCNNRYVPTGATNLCWRAAKLLKQKFNLNSGLDIEIKKRIPVGAGLGGGSSNAASVLLGLNKYWSLNLSQKKLASLGVKIGSDVAFFIHNTRFALAGGRGDKIKPVTALKELKLWFILVCPDVNVSTPLIYRKFDHFSGLTMPKGNVKILTSELLRKDKGFDTACLFNDLEGVTIRLYPVVNQVKKALSSIGLEKIMMSGSGPAVFAVCNSYRQAKDLSIKVAKEHKSWRVFVSSTV